MISGVWQRTVGGNQRMQLRSESKWGLLHQCDLLTSYMPNDYGAGLGSPTRRPTWPAWSRRRGPKSAAWPRSRRPGTCRSRWACTTSSRAAWVTAIHGDWESERYALARVRHRGAARLLRRGARRRGRAGPLAGVLEHREHEPGLPGQGRWSPTSTPSRPSARPNWRCGDGEPLATWAWLAWLATRPSRWTRRWRQLVFGAHHYVITGTEVDQVYLDLLGGWREAWQRGYEARRDAAGVLAARAWIPAGPAQPALVAIDTQGWLWSGPGSAPSWSPPRRGWPGSRRATMRRRSCSWPSTRGCIRTAAGPGRR